MENNIITIDWNLLDNISYKTALGKSLKNTLRKFNKEDLFEELYSMIVYFTESANKLEPFKNKRIKSVQSSHMKYIKYYPSKPTEEVFNDILGIQFIVNDYDVIDKIEIPELVRIVDMRNGKKNDDGYRGIHLYYQKDHFHYPIEIQFITGFDRQCNEWLHAYVYKYYDDINIGATLRKLYENGIILSEDDFRREFSNVLSNCKTV